MPYQLVRDHVSTDTVQALEQLLAGAKEGQIIGIAFGVLLKRRRYFVNTAGEARRDPTFTRGMMLALDDELRHMVQSAAGPETNI
jgi:hypothetical protein